MRKAWRWSNETSKKSLFDSILDKVVRDLFRGGGRQQRRRTGAVRPPAKLRRPSFALEILEPRLLLSGDPVLTLQSASVVQISQQNAPAADGGFIVNVNLNNNTTITYGTAQTGIHGLTIQGSAGDDTFNVVSALSIGLSIDGGQGADQIHVNGDVQTGGAELSLSAEMIAVAPALPGSTITLDTRHLRRRRNWTATPGKITLEARISRSAMPRCGLMLGSGFEAGAVEIKADDMRDPAVVLFRRSSSPTRTRASQSRIPASTRAR